MREASQRSRSSRIQSTKARTRRCRKRSCGQTSHCVTREAGGGRRSGHARAPLSNSRHIIRSLSSAIPIPFTAASIDIWLRSNSTRRQGFGTTPGSRKPASPLHLRLHRVDQAIIGEIGELERVGRAEARGADRQEALLHDTLDEKSRPVPLAMTDLDIDAFARKIGGFIGRIDPDVEMRVGVEEPAQAREDPFGR